MPLSRIAPVTFLILCSITISACGACGRSPEPAQTAGAAAPARDGGGAVAPAALSSDALAIPDGPWKDLARRLVGARDLASAVTVTREVLARGGVATFNGERDIVSAIGPSAGFSATPAETVHLAHEARRRRTAGTMTVAELAQMLETFGWPFRNARRGRDAADAPMRGRLADDLQEAVRQGRAEERAAEREVAASDDDAREGARQATMQREAEIIKRMQEATLAWQKARQAAAKAPADGKAAAEAQVKQAWDARQALIDERRRLQEASSQEQREMRDRRVAASEDARRMEDVQRRIGPDYQAGEQLMEMFALWVRKAAEDPGDPRNFTPLFLAEMALMQDPPLDLAGSRYSRPARSAGAPVDLRGAPRSQQLRFTLLELQLFAAAFHRTETSRAAAPTRSWSLPDSFPAFGGAVLHAQDPCSEFKGTLGKLVGSKLGADAGTAAAEGAGAVASELAGRAVDAAAGAALDAADAAAFGKAMSALGIAARIGKLLSFYNDNQITVSAEPSSTHKPPEGPGLATYTATAGISEEDWKEFEKALNADGAKVDRALRDCMNNLGLPTKTDVGDLAKEAENWLVDWRLTDGSPPHAWISLKNNDFYLKGRMAMKLKRSSPYSASAKLTVDILPESSRTGKIVRTYVTAQASLDAAGMPGLGTFINALKGPLGLADSLLELCVGWYQFMNMPKAYGTVEVEYHCPKETILVRTDKPVADGGGGDGPDDCLVEAGK